MNIYEYDFQEPQRTNLNVKDRLRAVRAYHNNAPVDEEDENQE